MDIGFAALADACFALWEGALRSKPVTDPAKYRSLAERALKPIRAFQNIFPIGRPVTHYYQGWYEWLTGRQTAAVKSWQNGLESAQKFNMPYEEALIRLKLGACLSGTDGRDHFERAIQIFESMGSVNELEVAKAEAEKYPAS